MPGRYDPYNTYRDPDEPPAWLKVIGYAVLCGLVWVLVTCAR